MRMGRQWNSLMIVCSVECSCPATRELETSEICEVINGSRSYLFIGLPHRRLIAEESSLCIHEQTFLQI
jgi:hypothetical protein